MVADVRHHDQVFADGEEGVDARLAVGVVPVEQIHRRDNEEVVRNLKPILQNILARSFTHSFAPLGRISTSAFYLNGTKICGRNQSDQRI